MERTPNSITPDSAEKVPFFKRIIGSVVRCYNYATGGVWSDTRNTFGVNLVKTINLSVRSFLNGELQLRAGSLTYQTLLAIVPALALVFAIGRGSVSRICCRRSFLNIFLLSDRHSALHSHSSTPIWRSRRRVFLSESAFSFCSGPSFRSLQMWRMCSI